MINASKGEQQLNLAYLKEMSGDNAEFMIEMLDTLLEQIPSYLDDLKAAIAANDWPATSAFAHKVKPTFYYVGREDLRDFVQKIEVNAKELLGLAEMQNAMNTLDAEMKVLNTQIVQAKLELQQRG